MSQVRLVRCCVRCGQHRPVSYRGLCRSCSTGASRAGELAAWPPIGATRRTLSQFAAEFAALEARQLSYMDICSTLGYSQANNGSVLRNMIIRAQKAGLLPKRTPLCGWRPKTWLG